MNDNLEQQTQALYKSWFVDFEPFGGRIPADWNYVMLVGKFPKPSDFTKGQNAFGKQDKTDHSTSCGYGKRKRAYRKEDATDRNKELRSIRMEKVQSLIKNIGNYQRLKPVNDAYQNAKNKTAFRSKHEAELVIFEAAKSTLLAMQSDGKLPSLKLLQAEQQRFVEEQQRLYDERAKFKKQAKQINTIKANVDVFLNLETDQEETRQMTEQRE